MNDYQKLQAWNKIKDMLKGIIDQKTNRLYHDTLLLKAIREWGFNPEKPDKIIKQETIELNDDEKKLLKQIKVAQEYAIDIRTQEEKDKLDKEFRLSMLDFVKTGGNLDDLPDNLRHSKCIVDGYFEAVKKIYG